jgi:hypothetical protein
MRTTLQLCGLLLAPAAALLIGTGAAQAATVSAPTLTMSGPADSADTSAAVSFGAPGTQVQATCSLDGAAPVACTSPYVVSGLKPGAHSVTVRIDAATGFAGATATWTVGPPPSTPTSAPTDVARFHRTSQAWWPGTADVATQAARYGYVILNGRSKALAQQFKARNPKVKVLLYKNVAHTLSAAHASPDLALSTGVDYYVANASHPDWFLKTRSGARVARSTGKQTSYLMDVGSTGYAQQWAANVTAQAKRDGWDGVFMDDALTTVRWWLPSHNLADVASYPSDPAWQAAMAHFTAVVGPILHQRGLVGIANIDGTVSAPAARRSYMAPIDGALDEGFVNPGVGHHAALAVDQPGAWNDWNAYLRELVDAEAAGKTILAETEGDAWDAARNRYAEATFLLAANGRSSFEFHSNDVAPTWMADGDLALRLGAALGSYERLPNGLYRRRFVNGMVLVNPHPAGTATLSTTLDRAAIGAGVSGTTVQLAGLQGSIVVYR